MKAFLQQSTMAAAVLGLMGGASMPIHENIIEAPRWPRQPKKNTSRQRKNKRSSFKGTQKYFRHNCYVAKRNAQITKLKAAHETNPYTGADLRHDKYLHSQARKMRRLGCANEGMTFAL